MSRYAIKVRAWEGRTDRWLWVTWATGNRYETEDREDAEGRAKVWRLDDKPENVEVVEI